MRAVVIMYYMRPTFNGAWVGQKTFLAKEDEIVDIVNEFIYDRANKEGFIPVLKFSVHLYRKSYNERPYKMWEYKPTNRKGYTVIKEGVSCPVLGPNKAFATHSDAFYWSRDTEGFKGAKIRPIKMDGDWTPIDRNGKPVKNPYFK